VNDSTDSENPGYTYSLTTLSAKWSSEDSESGIVLYNYSIYEGTVLFVDWITTTETSITVEGLELSDGATYHFLVKAKNGVGNWSDIGTSDGIIVDITKVPISCTNNLIDGVETDVDCGGNCSKCSIGESCDVSSDCRSGHCDSGNCSAPSCTDGVENQRETDIDCGGNSCERCDNDKKCKYDSDCRSWLCSSEVCLERGACNDNIKNGSETDIDCGGDGCGKCTHGKRCGVNSDCLSGLCSLGRCMEKDVCDNRVVDGNETDIDCGGTCPAKCLSGQDCIVDGDCGSNLGCISQICSDGTLAIIIPKGEEDSDGDGIPDEWELEHGLDSFDPYDADLDFDEDGLTNIQEYTFGSNPNQEDSDKDSFTDKEEIGVGTYPSDPVSKPGGIGGLLIVVIILIILFGAGSYAFYYHKDFFLSLIERIKGIFISLVKRIKHKVPEPSFTANIPKTQLKQQRHTPRKNLEKARIEEVVRERRGKKREQRDKLLWIFDKKKEKKQEKTKLPISAEKIRRMMAEKPKKENVFTELELISEKEEVKRRRLK
jgi:hypothetical protein